MEDNTKATTSTSSKSSSMNCMAMKPTLNRGRKWVKATLSLFKSKLSSGKKDPSPVHLDLAKSEMKLADTNPVNNIDSLEHTDSLTSTRSKTPLSSINKLYNLLDAIQRHDADADTHKTTTTDADSELYAWDESTDTCMLAKLVSHDTDSEDYTSTTSEDEEQLTIDTEPLTVTNVLPKYTGLPYQRV